MRIALCQSGDSGGSDVVGTYVKRGAIEYFPLYQKKKINYMKQFIFIIVFLCLHVEGQSQSVKQPYNCKILYEIIKRIQLEREYIDIKKQIKNKYIFTNDTFATKKEYENDKQIDSLIKLQNLLEIVRSTFDSLFYLSDKNIIIDTFFFFSPECNCSIGKNKFIIINDYRLLSKYSNYNVIRLNKLSEYHEYLTVSLRHRSSKNRLDNVAFLYTIEENVPRIVKVVVFDKRDIDIDRTKFWD